MGYNSGKAQNHNLHATQYKINCQNIKTTLNSLKTHKKTQNSASIGSRILNLKNTNFQKLQAFSCKNRWQGSDWWQGSNTDFECLEINTQSSKFYETL